MLTGVQKSEAHNWNALSTQYNACKSVMNLISVLGYKKQTLAVLE